MSTDSQHILMSFSSLPEPEQRLVAAEILRRASQWNTEPLNDDDLDRAADEIFLELDRREESHGN